MQATDLRPRKVIAAALNIFYKSSGRGGGISIGCSNNQVN